MEFQQSWQGASEGAKARVDFVRSVYLWLMGGFAVAALGALSAPVIGRALISVAGGFWHWILFGVQFGSLLFASAVSRKKPLNRIAFGLFTYISGAIAGIVALIVARGAGFTPVLTAFSLTGVVFLTLTVTAFVSKRDFSFLRNFVIVGVVVAVFGSLAAAIFHLETLSLVISGVAVIAFSAKLLWDTSAMLRTNDFGDPAGFALSLFVSLYNIFISLMNLLGGRRR
ncbi:MAG: Bax inhibitor-1 family protein [Geothrix sp.]|uniref:Bax inhibitor-1 family protein n=1 Tax=Candidatus Geothrix odensensis TaxID=2954440 RepID=A0A936K5J1_9BACT|nr:Bax inhibitor-1 family protein [Candidatus Geothrix odensensis]MBP7618334.1 Bax inhibitor-1 family protein [Geothrix sp.]MCC6514332.1 Bax inhibitor-1 family protein [Geothrix sp.]